MRALTAALLVAFGCGTGDREVTYGLPDGGYWPDPRQATAGGRILITNNFSDSVSVVDLDALLAGGTLRELARVPVGLNPVEREGPHHLAVDPDGAHYYVAISNFVPASGSGPHGNHGGGTADGHVLKLRVADHVEVGRTRIARNPGDIRMTPDGRRLLVSHFDLLALGEPDPSSSLEILDPATLTITATVALCPAAHGIAIAPDSRRAYVSCYDDHLAVVELDGPAPVVRKVPVVAAPGTLADPVCEPYALTLTPAGDAVWVGCFIDGRVLRYDVGTGAMDPAVAVPLGGGRALFGAFSADGRTLYAPHQAPDGLAVIDVATATVRAAIPVAGCVNPHVARFTPGHGWLLVVCEGDHGAPGTLLGIDPAAGQVRASLPLGVFPDDVQVVP